MDEHGIDKHAMDEHAIDNGTRTCTATPPAAQAVP